VVPGVSLANYPDSDFLSLAARDQGSLFGVELGFADTTSPFTLLSGLYFPEDVNLAAGLGMGTFKYADFFLTTNVVVARVTSASMEIEQDTPSALLIYRVNASNLSSHAKTRLLTTLEAADAAFANGQCAAGLRYLQVFQNKVRAQLTKTDSVLANHLLSGAQAIIDAGCAN